MILLSETERHPKVIKNGKVGVLTGILHLSPADTSGFEVCPMRSKGCTAACLHYAGFQYQKKYDARIKRTQMFFNDRRHFMMILAREIRNLEKRAANQRMSAGIRLNGTSDIPWETIRYPMTDLNIMEMFPAVMFMDYTKRPNRKCLPPNYRLTFSRSEDNDAACELALENGMNIAVVFSGALPERYKIGKWDLPVIDGDEHDWRYGDYDNRFGRVCIGLRAKGTMAKNDRSGFVVRSEG